MRTTTISGLAQAAGVNVETIRFYQRRGLLAEPDKPLGGIRRYGEAEVARVLFIKAAQRVAFSAQHLHGGLGVTLDYDLHFYYRRAKALELRLGSQAFHLERLGRML